MKNRKQKHYLFSGKTFLSQLILLREKFMLKKIFYMASIFCLFCLISMSALADSNVPYAVAANRPPDYVFHPGQAIDLKFLGMYLADGFDKGLFCDPAYNIGSLKFSEKGLDNSGLSFSQSHYVVNYKENNILEYTVEIKGVISLNAAGKFFHASIGASNWNGASPTTQDFNIYVRS